MKKRKEYLALKKCCRFMEDIRHPGYPFSVCGIVDFKTKDCYVDNARRDFTCEKNWNKFANIFHAGLLYQILDCDFVRKGSFVINSHMDNYKTILEAPYTKDDRDSFYIDINSQELVRLYFAVWSAIREYQDTDKLMFFVYDGDNEWVEVKVFDTLEEIKNYYKDYFTEED